MIGLQVLFEDNHLIAVNKPPGILVQADATEDKPLSEYVKQYIADRYDKPGAVFLGTIHRLDRPVSGVVIYARTSKALARMNQLFQDRAIEKTYWAITEERPDPLQAKLVHYIDKDRSRNVAHAHLKKRSKSGKKSELAYEMIAEIGNHHLLEVKPKTGRPHQIRVQLSHIGCPIRGDLKYGAPIANPDGSIHLHCRSLSFVHPVRKTPVTIKANPLVKDEVWKMFEGQWI